MTNKSKHKKDPFWDKVKEWHKDPEFRKGVKEFIKITTSGKSRNR